MPINKRQIPGYRVQDDSLINNNTFNELAGSRKTSEVGRHLLPLGDGAGGYTTDVTTATILPDLGKNIAVYNNDIAVHAITLGVDNTVAALAAGATNASGGVGIACTPNSWTYIACWDKQWVIADSALLLVYYIADASKLVVVS